MASIDIKVIQQHAAEIFALHATLKSLNYIPQYNPDCVPTVRYTDDWQDWLDRYYRNAPPTPLHIVWSNGSQSHYLYWDGHIESSRLVYLKQPLPLPPADVQARALALLKELDSNRDLLLMYYMGYIKGDIFTLNWLIPFPEGYKPGKGEGSGVYYTVKRDGTLGLAWPYADNDELYSALNL